MQCAAGRLFAQRYFLRGSRGASAARRHERTRPGLNHLAFRVAGEAVLDALVAEAPEHGWRLLFGDRHPYAGGNGHYAAYLENMDGFEVELVAL